MARYRITAPDGHTYEVTGNGTQAQALAHFQAQWQAQAPRQPEPEPMNVDPAEGMGPLDKALVGAGAAVARAGEGIGSLLGMDTRQMREDRKLYEKHHPGLAASAGEVLGDVALSALPVAAGARVGAQAGRMLPQALARFAPAAADVATGAAYGAATAPEDRGMAAGMGAAGAALGRGIQRVAGGVAKPFVSPEAKELMRQGIQPTVGQSLGGAVGRAEEKLASTPFVGAAVAHARNRAVKEFNEALVGKVAQSAEGHPVGNVREAVRTAAKRYGGSGDDAMLALRAKIGEVYERVLAQVPELHIDQTHIAQVAKEIADDSSLALSDATRDRLLAYVEKTLTGRTGPLSGQAAKRIESDLGKAAMTYSTSAVGEERAFGQALSRMHAAWRESLEGTLPPEAQNALMGANNAWRGLMQLDRAGNYATSQQRGGQYTPRVLLRALAGNDKSQFDNAMKKAMKVPVEAAERADPYAYIASMARAGQGLGDVVADSGTAGRLGPALLAGGALAGGVPGSAAGAAGIGVAALGSTRIGQKLLTQGLAPKTVEKVLALAARRGIPEERIMAALPALLAAVGRTSQPHPSDREALTKALSGI